MESYECHCVLAGLWVPPCALPSLIVAMKNVFVKVQFDNFVIHAVMQELCQVVLACGVSDRDVVGQAVFPVS